MRALESVAMIFAFNPIRCSLNWINCTYLHTASPGGRLSGGKSLVLNSDSDQLVYPLND